MNFSKKLIVGGAFALGLVFTGCLTDDGDDKGGNLSVSALSDKTAQYGDSVTFSASASGGTKPYAYKWYTVFDGDTTSEASDTGATFKGEVEDGMPSGVKLFVVVTDSKGAKVTSSAATLTIEFDDLKSVTLGAQGNGTTGSVLDLDSGKVWQSATANANIAKIDLVYLYYNGKASLNGAAAARDSGVKYTLNLTNGYGINAKNIQFVKVSSKPANVALASAAYTGGPLVRSSVVENGDKFVTKSSEGRYFYVEVTTVTGISDGTAAVKFVAGEID